MSNAPDIAFEHGLPSNVEAERTILGAILADNAAYAETAGRIEAEDFALDSHQRIFRRMEALLAKDSAVDIVTLAEELARRKEVDSIGGISYIASLTEGLPRRLSIEDYVRIVKEKSMLRQAINAASRLITQAADQSEDVAEILHEFRESAEVLAEKVTSDSLETFADFVRKHYPNVDELYRQNAAVEGIRSGFGEFDDRTCGFQREDFIIIAARPSMGKTAWLVRSIANQTIRLKYTAALFSLEMKKRQILDRAQASEARVEFDDLRKGRLNASRIRSLTEALDALCSAPFYIDDEPAQTVAQMRAKAVRLKQNQGLDIIWIDQLSHIELPPALVKNVPREQQVSKISKQLKLMARALKVPVVVLHQISRENTKRTDKRPQLSDLRESGTLEQDADMVCFIHREGYYAPKDESLRNEAELIIAKQRQGPIGTVLLHADLSIQRFDDHPSWMDGSRQRDMW